MYKKLKIFLGLIFIVALCAGISACKKTEELDKYDALVYYDSNGGSFYEREGVTIVDGFKFENYQPDGEGTYHFKLKEPLDKTRPGAITMTKARSFLAGWYKTRTAITDNDGNLIDAEGRILAEVDGKYAVTDGKGKFIDENGAPLVKRGDEYFVEGTDTKSKLLISYPQYTYADRWDFENDTFDCTAEEIEGGVPELRLYAGWVPYYEFYYYADLGNGWEKYGETYFNYDAVKEGSNYADYNTIFIPEWANGRMEHSHKYAKQDTFTFPALKGHTFKAAYTDSACTNKIDKSFVHQGTLDLEKGVAVNRVQNIYVQFDKGVQYRIEKAEQLCNKNENVKDYVDNIDLSGKYTILNDLHYGGAVTWPNAFLTGRFTGEFRSADGNPITIDGIEATFASSATMAYGGLFGRLGDGAKISNINFVGATVKVANTKLRQVCNFGLFTGEISKTAQVTAVTVSGTVMLGQLNPLSETLNINMLVAGENKGGVSVAADGIKLQVYGEEQNEVYAFTVNPENTHIEADGKVTTELYSSFTNKDKEIYDIDIWRQ